MLKAYKTEIFPTYEQANKIIQSIENCGSKARKQSIMNAERALKRYSKKISGKPRLKKKKEQDVQIYFPKNSETDLKVQRYKIKVPTIGWVRLKEKGYIPIKAKVTSYSISQKADRFYIISVLVEINQDISKINLDSKGIGIDMGLRDFAIISSDDVFENKNKTPEIKRVEKRLKRAQRDLSRKYEARKKEGESATKTESNIRKNILRVQKLHIRLARMRDAYRAWVVSVIAKTKPLFITIEKLNIRGMKKNRHLSKAISNQGFYDFKIKLKNMCTKLGIELREVDMFLSN
jgi:putative transposase